jgi:tripartite-type tricarboxylate transporter receptor subunit TctC
MIAKLARMIGCCLLGLASAVAGAAEPFPTKPIRVVIPFAPGGLADVNMRWVAERMTASLGQQVIIENRPGGDGLIGIRSVKTAPADGYTLLATSSLFSQALALKAEPGYEAKDFVPIGALHEAPLLMVGPTSLPDATLAQLLVRAKASPEAVSFGSGGVGTAAWLSGTLFGHLAGVKLLHVPYRGIAATRPDLVSGRLNFIFDTPGSVAPLIKDGQLRIFGVSTATRLPAYPDVPTLAEQGVTNYSFTLYGGVLAPAGTPKEIVTKLEQALRAVTTSEAFRERCRTVDGCEALPLDSAQFAERIRRDTERLVKLAADIGLPKQQ